MMKESVISEREQYWRDLRYGMFIHFGLYSHLGGVWQGRRIEKYSEQIRSHAAISKDEYAALAQVEELLTQYGPIAEIWFDMGAPTLEQSQEMAACVHRLQPTTMINGRIWNDQGDFAVASDNDVPNFRIAGPWQTPASIYKASWGYRSWQERTDLAGKIEEHTRMLRTVLERGGNYLLNIGPRGDGSVVEFEADVLRGTGRWIKENGGLENCVQRLDVDPDSEEISYRLTGSDYYSCKPVPLTKKKEK